MKRALAVQPTMFIQVSHTALVHVLEPAFVSAHSRVITLLCDTLETLYKEFYVQKAASENPSIPTQVSVRAHANPTPMSWP